MSLWLPMGHAQRVIDRAIGPTAQLPLAILFSFILMHYLVNSNIMSLGGIAIAIGVLVDAGIV